MRTFLVALMLIACEGCRQTTNIVNPPVLPEPTVNDAGVPLDDCGQACVHLRKLGCPDGAQTPGGATCESVCRANLPPVGGTDPKCLKGVSTCDQEATCTVK